MTEWLAVAAAALAGAALGVVFFWGLWLTVQKINKARHPGMLMLGSLLLRLALVLAGLYLITRYGGWQHLLAAAVGFTLPRLLMTSRMRRGLGRAANP